MDKYINKIINADCLDILKELPDKSIDTIICDLPYGTTACSWDNIIPFDELWEQYKRIRKEHTPIVLFGSEPFSTYLRMSNIKEFKYDWIWNKEKGSNFANMNYAPFKIHEIISVFAKGKYTYNPIMEYGKPKNHGQGNGKSQVYNMKVVVDNTSTNRYPLSILNYNCQNKECNNLNRLHPTQKPVDLIQYLVKTYSNENDIVLDNCSGSGTLAIASHKLNRRFICIEKDKDYYNASVERLENEKAQLKLF